MAGKLIILVTLILSSITFYSQIEHKDLTVKREGIYKEIDVDKSYNILTILKTKGSSKEKDKAMELVLQKPNEYIPVVLCALSTELMAKGQKDEGAFWYFVGVIRTFYDVKRCNDTSVSDAPAILTEDYGPGVYEYVNKDLIKFEEIILKAIDFVRKNKEEYDQRYINLHGMEAFMTGLDKKNPTMELSLPKDSWPKIKEETLMAYYEEFKQYEDYLKKKNN